MALPSRWFPHKGVKCWHALTISYWVLFWKLHFDSFGIIWSCSSGYIYLLEPIKECTSWALVFVCLFWLLEWIPSGNRTLTSEFLFFYCFYFPDFYFHFYFWFLAMFGSDSGLHTASVLFPINRRMGTFSLLGMTGQIIWYNSLLVCRRVSLAFTGKKKSPLRSRSVSIYILCFL